MATKTYSHAVIYNGKFYPANTPIKVKDEPVKVKDEPKKAVVKNDKPAGGKS